MSEVRIAAERRNEFGKGAARKIRRANKVPAILYGHGTDTQHLTLPGHDLMIALRTANVLIRIQGDGVNELALPKGVQRDPLKGFIEHIDLLLVKSGEKVTVEIPITVVGDIHPDGMLDQQMVSVAVGAEATHIPTEIEVSVEGMVIGTQLTAAELTLPEGVSLVAEPEALVLHVTAKPTGAEEEAEGAEAPTAEGNGESAE
ncbi:50S ribosomal protein L25/general stress protein Ctc [Streptosporangium sp. KLBMP 9127]|nr:50S ribosomal protein L25/general stress protein Ctc [Streptosporangium sp. KLBMP 9127]